jgi:hypothetical protein
LSADAFWSAAYAVPRGFTASVEARLVNVRGVDLDIDIVPMGGSLSAALVVADPIGPSRLAGDIVCGERARIGGKQVAHRFADGRLQIGLCDQGHDLVPSSPQARAGRGDTRFSAKAIATAINPPGANISSAILRTQPAVAWLRRLERHSCRDHGCLNRLFNAMTKIAPWLSVRDTAVATRINNHPARHVGGKLAAITSIQLARSMPCTALLTASTIAS